jgi:hypothetical protein
VPDPAPVQCDSEMSPFVFVSERGSQFTTAGFARIIERTASSAGTPCGVGIHGVPSVRVNKQHCNREEIPSLSPHWPYVRNIARSLNRMDVSL